MKKFILSLLSATLIFLSCLIPTLQASAFVPLDEIELYEITISTNEDATLNLNYHIRWKVLESDLEGPLTWVKIGVPNRFQSDLKALSPTIDDISYYSDDGAFVEVDFGREYKKGEIVDFAFSFKQERIFTFNEEENRIEFRFIPGWFPEIEVKEYRVLWKANQPLYTNTDKTQNGYYVWEGSLGFNQTIEVDVAYDPARFPKADYNKQYSDSTEDPLPFIIFACVIVLVVAFFIYMAVKAEREQGGGYYAYRGYYGNFYPHWWFWHSHGVDRSGKKLAPPPTVTNGGGGHSSGGHCACACACACAGGGRAGCSRKDFTVTASMLEESLTTEKESDD